MGPQGITGTSGESPEARIEVSKSVLTMTEPLEISGSGFNAGEPVAILLAIDANLQPVIGGGRGAQVSANAAGAFSIAFDEIGGNSAIQGRAPGQRAIVAQGVDGSRASIPVVIVKSPAGPPGVSSSMFVNPAAPGSDTVITGAGFNAGEFVTVSAVGISAGQDRILIGGEVNDFGAFQFELTIVEDMPPGVFSLKAIGDRGSEATAPLVVLGDK
jgi:hypothetical protein